MYPFSFQIDIQDNDFFTLTWDGTQEWYYFTPKAPLNGTAYYFMFQLWQPASVNFNANGTAITATDIYISNTPSTIPIAGDRYQTAIPNMMTGFFTSEDFNFTYYYRFSAYRSRTVSHEFWKALDNLILPP